MPKKRKKHPPQGDDVSTVYLKGGRGEQGEARPAISAPSGRPHLDLGRLRLKTWSKSDFSIAETTYPTYLYIYLYLSNIFGVLLLSYGIVKNNILYELVLVVVLYVLLLYHKDMYSYV